MSEKTEIPYKDIVFKDKNCLWFCGNFILMESFFSTFKLTVQNSMSLAWRDSSVIKNSYYSYREQS